jgi:SOS-response transcriptional repressor LexA
VVCKRFHRNNGHLLLTSDNPEGQIIAFTPEDLEWLGIVVRRISEL